MGSYEFEDRFVDADEYFRLALSTRKLIRSDDNIRDLCGLIDPEVGTRFVIHREHLPDSLPHSVHRSRDTQLNN